MFAVGGNAQTNHSINGTKSVKACVNKQTAKHFFNTEKRKCKDFSSMQKSYSNPDNGGIIYNRPEGELKVMYKHSKSYLVDNSGFMGVVVSEVSNGKIGNVVFADNGDVFIQNPVSFYPSGAWVKGRKETNGKGNSHIVIETPQPIFAEENYGDIDTTYLYKMDMVEYEDHYDYVPVTENSSIIFEMRNDSLILVGESLVGVGDATGYWLGYGDLDVNMGECGDSKITPPAELPIKKYALKYKDDYYSDQVGLLNICFDDNKVYMSGLPGISSDLWIKGEISDEKITFKGMQYMGADTISDYHIYFSPCETEKVWNEDLQEYDYIPVFTDNFYLDYDKETGIFSAPEKSFLLNGGKENVNFITYIKSPEFKEYIIKPEIPTAPTFIGISDYSENFKYGFFIFNVNPTSVDGWYINPKNLYYNIYFDGKKFTLENTEYTKIPEEEMTDIPYSYYDDYDIFAKGTERTFYFYKKDLKTIGVRAVYDENGEKKESDLVTMDAVTHEIIDGGTSSVNSFTSDRDIISVRYFDISGRSIEHRPNKGVFIKKIIYSDGKSESVKVVY